RRRTCCLRAHRPPAGGARRARCRRQGGKSAASSSASPRSGPVGPFGCGRSGRGAAPRGTLPSELLPTIPLFGAQHRADPGLGFPRDLTEPRLGLADGGTDARLLLPEETVDCPCLRRVEVELARELARKAPA